jgi:hypothetical protein
MSTDFRPLTPIRMEELLDGRSDDVGVYEHHSKDATSRCLTDGVNFLWVYSNEKGLVSTFTRWAPNGNPQRILCAIADQFDVDIVSEYEPEFWGYETTEEWNADWEAMAQKDEQINQKWSNDRWVGPSSSSSSIPACTCQSGP